MTDVARFVQDHPYQMLYTLMALGVVLVFNEIRHAAEKPAMRRAFLRLVPAVAPGQPAAPVAAAPNCSHGPWGGVLLTGRLIGGGFYALLGHHALTCLPWENLDASCALLASPCVAD